MKQIRNISAYVLSYLLWVVSVLFGGLIVLQIREAILSAMAVPAMHLTSKSAIFDANQRLRAVDQFSWLFVGVIIIALLLVIEAYYRGSVSKGLLRPRFLLVTTIECGILFLSSLFGAIVTWQANNKFTFSALYTPAVILVLTIIFFWLYSDYISPKAPGSQGTLRT